jgi:hypothetical protein
MSLFYVTAHSAANTTPTNILKHFKPSQFKSLSAVQKSYLYRATDLHGAGRGKPEWMIMYELAAEDRKPQQDLTIEKESAISNPEIKIHRQGLYSLQTSKSSPTFPSLNFGEAPNFLVAVFIRLHPGRKEEFDRYYTEEHMDALMKVPGWRRTRRFVTTGLPEDEAECVALHDYDLENGLGGEEFKHATTTDWYKDMMVNAVMSKDRRTYELCNVL